MKRPRKNILIFILATLTVLTSCRKKLNPPPWDVALLGPIANTSLDISDLLSDSALQVNPDNSLTFVYRDEVFSLSMDSMVEIPDTFIQYDFPWIYGTTTLYPGQTLFEDTQETKYDIGQVQLVQTIIRQGSIKVNIENTLDQDIEMLYEIPLATKDGNPFSVTELAQANGITYKTYDLSGYSIDLRGKDLSDYNTILIKYHVKMASYANPVQVTNGDYVRINNTLSGFVPEYAKGYFGQSHTNISPTTEPLHLFSQYVGGTLDLQSMNLKLSIRNKLGADISASISSLKSINTIMQNAVLLNHSFIGSYINLNRASEDNYAVYPPIASTSYDISMDNNNSNADQFIENLPDQLEYAMQVDINPDGNVSGDNDFIYYGSGLSFYIDMEFPIAFSSDHLTLQDTSNFSFGMRDSLHPGKYLADGYLYLYAYNGFPFDADIQLYLLDSNLTLFDTLVDQSAQTIEAAQLDIYKKVIEKKRSRIDIPVTKEQMDKFYDARFIIFRVSFTTASQPDKLKIYNDYSIDLKLIADVSYTIDIH